MKLSMLIAKPDFIDRVENVQSDGSGTLTISSGVGAGHLPRVANAKGDVAKIQQALNRFAPIDGGPIEPLKVDGIAGQKTRAAILRFQDRREELKSDGIVDVNGLTIAELRAGPDVLPPANSEERFESEIPAVIGILTAAQAALSVASAGLNLPNSRVGSGAFKALDRHFHTKTNGERRSSIVQLQRVFTTMQSAIGFIPQGRVLAAEEPPEFTVPGSLMFTFRGGFNLQIDPATKKTLRFKGLPVDRIYVCLAGRQLSAEEFRYCMIHELAHFIAGIRGIPIIEDEAYFHQQRRKYDQLTNFLALRNADSYARFAFEIIGQGDMKLRGAKPG